MDKQRLTLFLDPDLVKKAKAQALNEGVSLSEWLEKVLKKVLPSVITIKVKN